MSDANDTTPVDYRTIERHVGYRFGSDASVWSCWRLIHLGPRKGARSDPSGPWKLMCQRIDRLGYCHVIMKNPVKPGYCCNGVHRLIAEAFHGPCPEGMQCRHLDGNPSNNLPDNLRWGTATENQRDRVTHGTSNRKFTKSDVMAIREFVRSGKSYREVGRIFGVVHNTVSMALRRDLWK